MKDGVIGKVPCPICSGVGKECGMCGGLGSMHKIKIPPQPGCRKCEKGQCTMHPTWEYQQIEQEA